MKYSKLIKENITGIVFLVLIGVFSFIYFIVYMTPSRIAWYREMKNQFIVYYDELTNIGR